MTTSSLNSSGSLNGMVCAELSNRISYVAGARNVSMMSAAVASTCRSYGRWKRTAGISTQCTQRARSSGRSSSFIALSNTLFSTEPTAVDRQVPAPEIMGDLMCDPEAAYGIGDGHTTPFILGTPFVIAYLQRSGKSRELRGYVLSSEVSEVRTKSVTTYEASG